MYNLVTIQIAEMEEPEFVPRIKKCKRLIDYSDSEEEDELGDELLIPTQLNEPSSDNPIDDNFSNPNKL